MLIQVLLGLNFDAAVVFVKTFLLLFRLALAILWPAVFASGQKYVKNPPLRDLIKIKTSIFLGKLLKNECLEF